MVKIDGTTGIDTIQNNTVTSAKIVDGSVTPADTQVGALPSMVRLTGTNGYGSTNTKIRRWLTTVTNQGSDITSTDSATLGGSFTINTNGVYSISVSDQFSAGEQFCITLNDSTPTGAPLISETLASTNTSGANATSNCSWTGYLVAGAVIREHTTNASAVGANTFANTATITRVG